MGESAHGYSSSRSGDVLEELPACYANLLYLRSYADEKYKEQVTKVFENKSISKLLRNLGEKNTILTSGLQPMEVDSLFAIIFEAILIGIGIPKETIAREIVRSILDFRRSASGIREFIKRIEIQFGRGTYSKIRRIDELNNEINAGELQEIISLVRPYINLKNPLALSATIET